MPCVSDEKTVAKKSQKENIQGNVKEDSLSPLEEERKCAMVISQISLAQACLVEL